MARAHRGHPFAPVPEVHTGSPAAACSSRTCSRARASRQVKRRDEATRDRFGEIVFRFYFGLVKHLGRVSRRPASGQLPAAGRRARRLPRLRPHARARAPATWSASARSRSPSRRGDPAGVHAALAALGLPAGPGAFVPEDLLAQVAGHGRVVPRARRAADHAGLGRRRCSTRRAARARRSSSRCGARRSRRRRCSCAGWRGSCSPRSARLRAAADWNAIAREYYAARRRRPRSARPSARSGRPSAAA